jgi:hypothetical protein
MKRDRKCASQGFSGTTGTGCCWSEGAHDNGYARYVPESSCVLYLLPGLGSALEQGCPGIHDRDRDHDHDHDLTDPAECASLTAAVLRAERLAR